MNAQRQSTVKRRNDNTRISGIACAGDIVIFLLFAALGRAQHSSSGGPPLLGTVWTAAPFILGWFLAAYVSGAIGRHMLLRIRTTVRRTVSAWVAGCAIALVVRSILEGHATPLSFAVIAFGFNLALLVAWHTALCLLPLRRNLEA
jgi:hypothetical protein